MGNIYLANFDEILAFSLRNPNFKNAQFSEIFKKNLGLFHKLTLIYEY